MIIKAQITSDSGYIALHKSKGSQSRKLDSWLLHKTPHALDYEGEDANLRLEASFLAVRGEE